MNRRNPGHTRRFARDHQTFTLGALLTACVLLLAAAGPAIQRWGPEEMDFLALLAPPSPQHLFGTDSFGRDVLVRVMYGARTSIAVSLSGVAIAATMGTILGMIAGFLGGLVDAAIMRLCDVLLSLPSFVLALFLMLVLGFGLFNVVLSIGLIYLPNFARLARNTTRLVVSEPFIDAARVMGQSGLRILLQEILPNIAAPLFVQLSTALAFGILVESGLSFLGLGVQPPAASLGTMMSDGKDYFQRGPWVLSFTGLAVTIIILGLNLLSDGVRDMLDPNLRDRSAG